MPETAAWFFDSVTLSNFALADGVYVLALRYQGRGFIATQVVDELARGVAMGHSALSGCLGLLDKGVLRVASLDKTERVTFGRLLAHLGQGESGTIAAALHRQGIAVTDDLAARRTCAELGVPVTGTIGILVAAVRDQQLTKADADAMLQRMIGAGFHSPVKRLPDGEEIA